MVHRCARVCSDLDQHSDKGNAGGPRFALDDRAVVAILERNGRCTQFRSPAIAYTGSHLRMEEPAEPTASYRRI
jgi:hypothetical protein